LVTAQGVPAARGCVKRGGEWGRLCGARAEAGQLVAPGSQKKDFGQGGKGAVRLCKRCSERRLPLRIDIVAKLAQHEHGLGKKRGTKRAGVTRESRNPKHGQRKHYIVHKPSGEN
jgi:hypothetical protein